ncbi:hypothetical protein [Turicibacter sanguinis]
MKAEKTLEEKIHILTDVFAVADIIPKENQPVIEALVLGYSLGYADGKLA